MVCRTIIPLIVALAATTARAQAPYAPFFRLPVPPIPVEPVQETTTDISPLSASLRHTPSGLRQPVGFQTVYQVPGRPDLFMRVNGALYAVFPQSEYRNSSRGLVAQIPANTVFYIGGPPGSQPPTFKPAAALVATAQQAQVRDPATPATEQQSEVRATFEPPRADPGTRAGPDATPLLPPLDAEPKAPLIYDHGEPMTIVTDSAYRLARLQHLLLWAAHVEQQRSATQPSDTK